MTQRDQYFISPEHVAERVGDIGNEPLTESDARIAAVIANMLQDLTFKDDLSAAILAVESIRFYDQLENADKPGKVLKWYRNERERGSQP